MRRTELLQGLRTMKIEEVYEQTLERSLSQLEAAFILGISERTFGRWRDRFEAEGAAGLYDRHFGHVSPHRVRVHHYPDQTLAIFHGPRKLASYDKTGNLREGKDQLAA